MAPRNKKIIIKKEEEPASTRREEKETRSGQNTGTGKLTNKAFDQVLNV